MLRDAETLHTKKKRNAVIALFFSADHLRFGLLASFSHQVMLYIFICNSVGPSAVSNIQLITPSLQA